MRRGLTRRQRKIQSMVWDRMKPQWDAWFRKMRVAPPGWKFGKMPLWIWERRQRTFRRKRAA